MKTKHKKSSILIFVFLIGGVFLVNCTTSRNVRPLKKKQMKLGFDLGGPMIVLGDVPFPVPFTAVSFSYGVEDDITASGAVYLTDILFGVIHLDAGGTVGILRPKEFIPGLSLSPSITFLIDVWEWVPKVYPSVDFNVYWNISPRDDIFYIGMGNWFELETTRANGDEQPNIWIPSVNIGYTFVSSKWMFTLEARYMGLNVNNQDIIINYVSPGSTGAIGAFLSAARLF